MNVYEPNRMSLDEVECIEVMRGAGSGLYGSNAMGGVINIIIKKNKTAGVSRHLIGRSGTSFVHGGGVLTGKVGKLNLDVNYNLTEVRKSDRRQTPTCMDRGAMSISRAAASLMKRGAFSFWGRPI